MNVTTIDGCTRGGGGGEGGLGPKRSIFLKVTAISTFRYYKTNL
jgi:hypothetical protein